MNKKVLLTIGGAINAFFVLFHIVMVYSVHVSPGISAADRPLMEMLAVGGALMIFFLAYTSLFYKEEMLTTKIGKFTILLNVLVYLSRALEEIIISPAFSIAIFISCLLVGVIYSLLLLPSKVPVNELENVA